MEPFAEVLARLGAPTATATFEPTAEIVGEGVERTIAEVSLVQDEMEDVVQLLASRTLTDQLLPLLLETS